MNDHATACQYGEIPLEHFHEILQSKISEEEHNCRLIENIFTYLSYKTTDFIGKSYFIVFLILKILGEYFFTMKILYNEIF